MTDFGTFIGRRRLCLAWRYNLSAGSRFIDGCNAYADEHGIDTVGRWELRFYGLIVWNLAIGVLVRVGRTP